jgi:glycosyltransferase involved in cell wall biosynthesis
MRILALPAFKNRAENPYNASLYAALSEIPGVTVAEFTNRRVVTERWDIVHIHWPDTPLHRTRAGQAALYSFLLIARLWWARMLGARIVWTVHNLRSHTARWPRIEKWLWRLFVPLVHSSIHLSHAGREMAMDSFPGLAAKPSCIVPHGHYRDCYPNGSSREQARAALGIAPAAPVIAFTGQIKAYKNVPALIRAFIEAADPDAVLLIAGRPGDAAIEAELNAAAGGHPRIQFHLGLIPDDRMHLYLNACDLAAFPYRDILNSGSAILALSFNRPALVPARGAMAELRQAAGADWVHTYEGDLTGPVLAEALRQAVGASRPAVCDLSALSWPTVAAGTLAAYRSATGHGTASAYRETALA